MYVCVYIYILYIYIYIQMYMYKFDYKYNSFLILLNGVELKLHYCYKCCSNNSW